jgi:hypothetical protein
MPDVTTLALAVNCNHQSNVIITTLIQGIFISKTKCRPAQRWCEVRIGELIGPAPEFGSVNQHSALHCGAKQLDEHERYWFRKTNRQYVSDAKAVEEKAPEKLEQVNGGGRLFPSSNCRLLQ